MVFRSASDITGSTFVTPIANLRIATSETWKDKATGDRKERTEWHSVVIFNEALAKVAEQYLRKGAKVYIESREQSPARSAGIVGRSMPHGTSCRGWTINWRHRPTRAMMNSRSGCGTTGMRVNLKGIHTVKVKLAGGKIGVYRYAWRGGPKLDGEPGTPQFMASYNAAVATLKAPKAGRFHSVIVGFKASGEFRGLAARTQSDYLKHIARIEVKFGTLPLSGFNEANAKTTRGVFKKWRDENAAKSARQAGDARASSAGSAHGARTAAIST